MVLFKFPELKVEFDGKKDVGEARLHPRLRLMVFALTGFADYHFGRDIIITHILRTQEEQDAFYGNDPRYEAAPWKSVHQFGRGVDIRSTSFTRDEIGRMVDFINLNFPYGGGKSAALQHNIGSGAHIHLQTPAV